MDAFYASVEQRDFPELRGKPIAVGGGSKRGVTTTASYEARKFGVRSAMPGYIAKQKCPDLIFVPPRFEAYKEASQQIRAIFHEYTDLIEPLSLDEAYLDVTENKKSIAIATEVAKEIKRRVFEETQLTCSAGVSYCKFLAKIASDINKPDGITIVKPHQAEKFLEDLPIKKFYGVGKVTEAKMNAHGIFLGKDLKAWSKGNLLKHFGKPGGFYYDIVRGIDDRPVKVNRIRKSLGVERTLESNIDNIEELLPFFESIIDKFYERLKKADKFGGTITLKMKSADFQIITRAHSSSQVILELSEIKRVSIKLLRTNFKPNQEIRLIGLTASNFDEIAKPKTNDGQLELEF